MFESLNILWIYPVFNATISCLIVVIITGIKDRAIKRVQIAIVAIYSLIIGVILLCISNNWEHLVTLLPFIIAILSDNIGTTHILYCDRPWESRAWGLSSGPAGWRPILPKTEGLPCPEAASAPSMEPASGPPVEPAGSQSDQVIVGDMMSDAQLDSLYGPCYNREQLAGICAKITEQINQRNPQFKEPKSIYGKYPANQSTTGKDATLNYAEQKAMARKLLGLDKGYSAHVGDNYNNPIIKVMKPVPNDGYKAITNTSTVLKELW